MPSVGSLLLDSVGLMRRCSGEISLACHEQVLSPCAPGRVLTGSCSPRALNFGLWSVHFPPVLVRTGRRLPVQALGERRVLVTVTGYPRGGAPY